MWPILVASLAAMTVVIERISFLIREQKSRCPWNLRRDGLAIFCQFLVKNRVMCCTLPIT
ncbi:MAG: hypothetical protein AAB332_07030 [Planctomycetota bacterium]